VFNGLLAQTPQHTAPTLQVGLDGLSFGKGSLDSELILEIIAEKQGEIKLRVAQNILLTPLNKTGATIYSYGDNILKAVIEEKDPVIRKRRILESTVNTLFTVAFTKYYLNKIQSEGSLNEELLYSVNLLSAYIFSKGKKIDFERDKIKYSPTGNIDQQKPTIFEKGDEFRDSTDQLIFYSTILDIAAEAIRKSNKLNELGILNVSYSKTFDYQSNYLNLWKSANDFKKDTAETENTWNIRKEKAEKSMKKIHDSMVKELENLTKVIGVTKFILDESNLRTLAKGLTTNIYEGWNGDLKIDSVKNHVIKIASNPILNASQANKINSIVNYLDKVKNLVDPDTIGLDANQIKARKKKLELEKEKYSEIVYTLSNDFIPALENIGISSEYIFTSLSDLRKLSRNYTSKVLDDPTLKQTVDFLLREENLSFFTKLYSRLYDFDKGNTYVEYFVLISEITNFLEQSPEFSNSEVKEKLSYFNTFAKDYVVINETEEGQEYIDFKVESFLTKLSDMPTESPPNISFLFDVGASTGWFPFNSLPIDGEDPVKNLSFIGEKIGLKFKFWDYGFSRRKSPGETYRIWGYDYIKTGVPKEPVINNLFISIYGSGLLYNLFDVSTENEFDSIFLGGALGLGFFNNLDASVSYAVPQISNQSFGDSFQYGLVSINFDFRFNEYIEKLGEKRKDLQNKKALANASEAN
tara:strand:- start:3940 stop:6027 length:2088 start_codon:yes stop_codon:yes gene_type:complete